MGLRNRARQNLFSANQRNAMLRRYGWTDALRVTVDDLLFEATMQAEYEKKTRSGKLVF